LAVTAQPYLQRYQATHQGGLALLLSSASNQESAALGNFSAFAKAFADSMAGGGDLNGDSKITLGELQIDSRKRTYDLLAAARNPRKQDANVTWSPSLSKDTPLGAAGKSSTQVALAQPLPIETPRRFMGTETLPGFGKLSFALYSNGRAVMTDAKSTQEGIWRRQGDRFTLSFANGAVVYTGALSGATLSGTATSPSTRQAGTQSWTWSAQRQTG